MSPLHAHCVRTHQGSGCWLFVHRLLRAAGAALVHPATQSYAPLWLSLIQQTLCLSPQHAGTAALVLPLKAVHTSEQLAAPAAAGVDAREQGDAACSQALLETWSLVGYWLAAADTRGMGHRPGCLCICKLDSNPAA